MKNNPVKKNFFLVSLKNIESEDINYVPKNISVLHSLNRSLPPGFSNSTGLVVKSSLFSTWIDSSDEKEKIKRLIQKIFASEELTKKRLCHSLEDVLSKIPFPKNVEKQIYSSYKKFFSQTSKQVIKISGFGFWNIANSVHSTQECFLIKNNLDITKIIKHALISTFCSELAYYQTPFISNQTLNISLLIEKLSPVDAHGTVCTFDPFSDSEKVFHISSWLGNNGLKKKQGLEDVFLVSKHGIETKKQALISRVLGDKSYQAVVSKVGVIERVSVPAKQRSIFSLNSAQVHDLSVLAQQLEEKFGPCRFQWETKEGKFIIQSVEPVLLKKEYRFFETYTLPSKSKLIIKGKGIGNKIAGGKIRILAKPVDAQSVQYGDVIVVKKEFHGVYQSIAKCSALILTEEKKYMHLLLEAREYGIPVVLTDQYSLKIVKNGKRVTVSQGCVYQGALPFEVKKERAPNLGKTKTKAMIHIENPDNAFCLAQLNPDGVGMLNCESLWDHALPLIERKLKIIVKDQGFTSVREYLLEQLTTALSKVAAAFFPNPIRVCFSDGKNARILSVIQSVGMQGEKQGFSLEAEASWVFNLECEAVKRVRENMGFINVMAMLPFSPLEKPENIFSLLKKNGLERGKNGLEIYAHCEIPANAILAKDFLPWFDGFSLNIHSGNADVLGEKQNRVNSSAIQSVIKDLIIQSHKNKKVVVYQNVDADHMSEYTKFLVQNKVDAISFPQDAFVDMKAQIHGLERTVGRTGERTHKGFLSLIIGFGALAATFIGMGSGCTQVMDQGISDAPALVNEYLPPAKIREELEKNFEKQIAKFTQETLIPYKESGFGQFSLQYPLSWSVEHDLESVVFQGSTSTDYIRIFTRSTSLIGSNVSSSIQVGGKSAFSAQNISLSDGIAPEWIEVPLENGKILVLEGGGEQFEKIVGTVVLQE